MYGKLSKTSTWQSRAAARDSRELSHAAPVWLKSAAVDRMHSRLCFSIICVLVIILDHVDGAKSVVNVFVNPAGALSLPLLPRTDDYFSYHENRLVNNRESTGNDSNSGKTPYIDGPNGAVRTISRARDILRELTSDTKRIILSDGVYRVTQTISLDSRDSGLQILGNGRSYKLFRFAAFGTKIIV
jgi:hypothetical protein